MTTSGAPAPVRSLPGAVAALRRPEMLGVAEVDQRVQVIGGDEHDVAPLAAIAAVGPAELEVFLAPERDHAVPAVTGAEVDLGLVEEFHVGVFSLSPAGEGWGEGPGRSTEPSPNPLPGERAY